MVESLTPKYEADPAVPELHRRIVKTGLFDLMPQPDLYEDDELVVARRNGDVYQAQEVNGTTVRIWYKTDETEADEVVARTDVRPINAYGQIAYQLAEPMTEITIDKNGHALIKRQAPLFPGSK